MRSSLQAQLFLILAGVVVALATALGWVAYGSSEKLIERDALRTVGIAADARKTAVENRIRGFIEHANAFLRGVDGLCAGTRRGERCYQGALQELALGEGAVSAELRRPGLGTLHVGPPDLTTQAGTPPAAFDDSEVRVVFDAGGNPFLLIHLAQEALGLDLRLRYAASEMDEILGDRFGLGESGSLALFDAGGRRISPRESAHFRGPVPSAGLSRPMRDCLAGKDGQALDLDSRGVPSIHGYRFVPEIGGGCLMVNIDQEEAFAPVKRLRQEIGLVAAFFATVSLLVAALFLRKVARPVARDLIESERRTRQILEGVRDAVIAVDAAGRISFMNHVAERLTGWGQSLARGAQFEKAVVLRGNGPDRVLVHRHGWETPVDDSSSPIRDERGELVGSVILLRDVSERVREETRRRFLVEVSSLLIHGRNVQETLRSICALSQPRIADWCEAELIGDMKTRRHGRSESIVARAMRTRRAILVPRLSDRRAESAEFDDPHFEQVRHRGLRSVMVIPLVVRDHTFGVMSFVSMSDRRLFGEADLRMAEELGREAAAAVENTRLFEDANRAVQVRDEFLSIASHELKTPLSSLRLQIQLIRQNLDPSAGQVITRLIGMANEQIGRLAKLIDNLLDVSKATSGGLVLEPERISLSELVEGAVTRFRPEFQQAHCPVTTEIEPGIEAEVDRARVEQVVVNLLSNAMKYGECKPVGVSLRRSGETAVLSVRDGGIGISAEDLPRLFGRFERAKTARKFGGLGLGLYICRQIIEAHQGQIRVESRVGKGTVFTVELPLHALQVEKKIA